MFWGEGETTLFEALMLLCTDAANGLMLLMLLNQNQDQLADFSIAFCSSYILTHFQTITPKSCQKFPIFNKSYHHLPNVAKTCCKLPRFAKICHKLPGFAISCQDLP